MKSTEWNQGDEDLRALLQAARPVAELPPRFGAQVWQRLEERPSNFESMIELLANWFLTPRIAAAVLASLVVFAAVAGAMRGVHVGQQEARERYLASVAPSYLQH